MSNINIGVIGAGRIGRIHIDNVIRECEGARISWVCDSQLDETWANSRNLNACRDIGVALHDLKADAIIVATPATLHVELVEAALLRGKHVFCEKPVGSNPDDIERVTRLALSKGLIFQVGFNRRFDANFARMADVVTRGELGEVHVVRITSRDPEPPSADYVSKSGGLFLDCTIHDFDMARFLTKSEVTEVYAAGAVRINPEFEALGDVDTAVTTLRMQSGTLCVIDNSRKACYGYDQRAEVFGAKGSMESSNMTSSRTVLRNELGEHGEKPLWFFLERYAQSFKDEMASFVKSVHDKSAPLVGGDDAAKAMRIAIAAKRSHFEKRPVKVEGIN